MRFRTSDDMVVTAETLLDEKKRRSRFSPPTPGRRSTNCAPTPGRPPRPAGRPRANAPTPPTGAISAPLAISAQPLEKVKFGENRAATPVRGRIKRRRRAFSVQKPISSVSFLHFDSCNGFCAVNNANARDMTGFSKRLPAVQEVYFSHSDRIFYLFEGMGTFSPFAARIGCQRLPAEPETVALYVADLKRRGRRPATIARKLTAIAVYHRSMDHPTPTEP
jgi:hypothetical protein